MPEVKQGDPCWLLPICSIDVRQIVHCENAELVNLDGLTRIACGGKLWFSRSEAHASEEEARRQVVLNCWSTLQWVDQHKADALAALARMAAPETPEVPSPHNEDGRLCDANGVPF